MKLLLSSLAVISAFGINTQNFDYLDINKVKAGISFNGTIHYNPANTYPSYEVPKGSERHTSSETSL